MGMERPELLASVEEPKAEEEPAAAAIWEAMDGLARFGQLSVIHRVRFTPVLMEPVAKG